MVAAVINLVIAVLDYSPMRPGPNPTAGFLLGWIGPLHVRFLRCLGALWHRSFGARLLFAER